MSTNGTYVKVHKTSEDTTTNFNRVERIDEKIKRQILSHKDCIYVEISRKICFEFHSLQSNAPILPDEMQNDISKDYHIGRELGNGAYGTVYFVLHRKTCQPFALKLTTNDKDENRISNLLRECGILKKLEHPCILQLHKVKTYVNSVAILIEYMKGGDLFNRLKDNGHFSERLTKFLFYQICCGVEYLHEKRVSHRDIKPENILLATGDEYTLVKVSDFGLSKCLNSSNSILSTQVGTRCYQAPEVKDAPMKPYTNKVDIWSLGVLLYVCLSGHYPFQLVENYLQFNHDVWYDVSDVAKNLIRVMVKIKPNERPSAKELLEQRSWLAQDDPMVIKACETMTTSYKKL